MTSSRISGRIMRATISILGVVAALWAAPASAQGLNWFYCYAPNAATGVVYVSDVHAVGPVSERAGYGNEFAGFLASRGKLPAHAQAYCVMRATEQEVVRGQQSVTELCSECGGATTVEHIAWLRGGQRGRQLATPVPAADASLGERPRGAARGSVATGRTEPVEGVGAYIMGRSDATGIVHTANEENAQFQTRHKADLKGGQWTWIAMNDRCPGWVAVAYATDGDERHYFVAKGSDFEGTARVAAIKLAEAYAARKGAAWLAGVLSSFKNEYRHPPTDFSRGAIRGVRQEVERMVTTPCADSRGVRYTAVGVRG